jgi:hypothetical protein
MAYYCRLGKKKQNGMRSKMSAAVASSSVVVEKVVRSNRHPVDETAPHTHKSRKTKPKRFAHHINSDYTRAIRHERKEGDGWDMMPWRSYRKESRRIARDDETKKEIAPTMSGTRMRSRDDSPHETAVNVRERYTTRGNERDGFDATSWGDRFGKSSKISRGRPPRRKQLPQSRKTIRFAQQNSSNHSRLSRAQECCSLP